MQGAYRDDNGQPVVLNCVREAEKRVAGNKFMECVTFDRSLAWASIFHWHRLPGESNPWNGY
jgi:hypothetical protein